MSEELQMALTSYEYAKTNAMVGLLERLQFSEFDTGFKNPYSGAMIKARHDGALEMLANGKLPVIIRAISEKGTLSMFAPEVVNLISKRVNIFTEENGIVINGHRLNYDVLSEEGKLVFLSDEAIRALELLLNQGIIGTPAPGQMPVSSGINSISSCHLFMKDNKAYQWDDIEIKALEALGLKKVAGLLD